MFFLNRDQFRGADESKLHDFVACWERYYRDSINLTPTSSREIDYIYELSPGNELSERNITRLLRWKDPRMLTHPHKNGRSNPRVGRVLDNLGSINQFRLGQMSADDFSGIARGIFPNGFIWPLFLFHIARPSHWPIGDQHVFRATGVLYGDARPEDIESFQRYRTRFSHLAEKLPLERGGGEYETVRRNKRLDSALMAYGQFLKVYDR